MGLVLLLGGTAGLYSSWQDARQYVQALQQEKAGGAAQRIQGFVTDIERQLAWTQAGLGQLDDATTEARRVELLKLLRQAPAITDARWLDSAGIERLRVSRIAVDDSQTDRDRSREPEFTESRNGRIHRGPVVFRDDTEPYMSIASGSAGNAGTLLVDVNLKFVRDVVSTLRTGRTGVAYVVDSQGALIAHPDLTLVLQKTLLGGLAQVREALDNARSGLASSTMAVNLAGEPVIATSAPIPGPGWLVIIEAHRDEVFAALYQRAYWLIGLLLLALVFAALAGTYMARRLTRPIQTLQASAERIGAGDLSHRVHLQTGDELEQLGQRLNQMAENLASIYATLENRVADRTRSLAQANEAKTRFLATASHDLRQPIHAIAMYIDQLRSSVTDSSQRALVQRIDSSLLAFQNLLQSLLDVSRLDAQVVRIREEPIAIRDLLLRLAERFAAPAAAKGLRLRVRAGHWVITSDPVQLERIITNLLSNAVRHTATGGVLLACRQRGGRAQLLVIDSGCGIAPEHLPQVFDEFFQVRATAGEPDTGLGLGLAIVRRLVDLMGYEIQIDSRVDRGTQVCILLGPIESTQAVEANAALQSSPLWSGAPSTSVSVSASNSASASPNTNPQPDPLQGRLVLVLDDDPAIRDATGRQLEGWGMRVEMAASISEARTRLAQNVAFDLAIIDCSLASADDGLEFAWALSGLSPCKVILVSGQASPPPSTDRSPALPWLAKPVRPARLRALLDAQLRGP